MKKTVRIRILDEVNCTLTGLSPDHIKYMSDEFKRRPDNYFFNPKYKMGAWDGYIYFFSKVGKTYVYLLDEIIPILIKMDYSIDLVDGRRSTVDEFEQITAEYFKNVLTDEGLPLSLRPYQVDAVNALLDNKGGVVLASTGAGKTYMVAALSDVLNKNNIRPIVIVPSTDLVLQTSGDLLTCGIDVGMYCGDHKDTEQDVIVSTWQSLKNNPTMMKQFNAVIVDECHTIKGVVLQEILNKHGTHIVYRFGVTGTLPKAETDAMAVKITIGTPQFSVTAKELIDQDFLASLHIDIIQLEEDVRKQYDAFLECNPDLKPIPSYAVYKNQYFGEYSAEKQYLQSAPERIGWIARYLMSKRDMGNGNVFCLVNGVAVGKKLAKQIPGAIFVHGGDKNQERKKVYDLFKDNDDLIVIATVHVASTGLNIKRIFNLCFIDLGKSFIRVIQTIGRGLRKAPDKDHVDVIDICTDLKYGKKHLSERMSFYNDAKYPHKKRKVKY